MLRVVGRVTVVVVAAPVEVLAEVLALVLTAEAAAFMVVVAAAVVNLGLAAMLVEERFGLYGRAPLAHTPQLVLGIRKYETLY